MTDLRFYAYQYQHLPLDTLRGRWPTWFVELHDAISSEQSASRVRYPLGAFFRDCASTRRQGRA